MAKPRITKLGYTKTGLYGLVTVLMLSGCATNLPIQGDLLESGPDAAPKEYLPHPVYDYCLSEHDISVSLKVMNAEKFDVNDTVFTISIIAKSNKRKPIPLDAGGLSEHIGIGYVGHLSGFEVIQVNELPQSEPVSGVLELKYEILAKLPVNNQNSSNYAPRYQVVLINWYHRLGAQGSSDFQCPVLYKKESEGLKVLYE